MTDGRRRPQELPLEVRCHLHDTFAKALYQHGDPVLKEMVLFIMCLLAERGDAEGVVDMVNEVRADIYRAQLHFDECSALAPPVDGEH